ncbi:SH3 domain-containing protein [Chryseobacterium oranimense]|uniref:SH3 domain-containing protein n=1 Tax=Chryseobacterium oranimense TaxID=421058 RepID=UPI0021AECBAB|nr:SH3 domain-containing protein [Chryseobacterium oranimense]UWX59981.1 SH3 domain-containing protein [Chryseobacterium oranimense]
MKTFISILILCIGTFTALSFNLSDSESLHHGGRCTGSASCSACSNCTGCAHCSSGGSCGVCSGSSYGKKSSSKKKKSKAYYPDSHYTKKNKSYSSPKIRIDEININTNNRYFAGVAVTKIYAKPFLNSKVIETVPKNTELKQLSKHDSWYKVQVKKSGKVGYVYYKDVK